jgi:hypothetical protein
VDLGGEGRSPCPCASVGGFYPQIYANSILGIHETRKPGRIFVFLIVPVFKYFLVSLLRVSVGIDQHSIPLTNGKSIT